MKIKKHLAQLKLKYLIVLILLLATFFRFYNLPNTLMFQGDQGRDALVVSKIFKEFDPVFIGPVTSVGNMYLGPLYYYFMLPFLYLSFPEPTGPAYAVAAVGVLTCFLLFKITKKMFAFAPAALALFFFSFSAEIIRYSRFSWNPNIAPLFSLLMAFFSYLAIKKSAKYWILVAVCFSILIQLHYIILLSATAAGLIWLYQLTGIIRQKKKQLKSFLIISLISVAIVAASTLPIIIFDSRHGWLNAQAFSKILTQEELLKREQFNWKQKALRTAKRSIDKSEQIFFDHILERKSNLNLILLAVLVATLSDAYLKNRIKQKTALAVTGVYLLVGILGTAVYEHNVYAHYILYLFPLVSIIYGLVLTQLWRSKNILIKSLPVIFIIYFLAQNLPLIPIQDMGWKISDVRHVAEVIVQELEENEEYSLILLSESGDIDGQNYRYYLYGLGHPALEKENFARANRLFIINENQKQEKIGSLPIYEIVTFPNHSVDKTITIPGGPDINIMAR